MVGRHPANEENLRRCEAATAHPPENLSESTAASLEALHQSGLARAIGPDVPRISPADGECRVFDGVLVIVAFVKPLTRNKGGTSHLSAGMR